jgi:hypothetical protein
VAFGEPTDRTSHSCSARSADDETLTTSGRLAMRLGATRTAATSGHLVPAIRKCVMVDSSATSTVLVVDRDREPAVRRSAALEARADAVTLRTDARPVAVRATVEREGADRVLLGSEHARARHVAGRAVVHACPRSTVAVVMVAGHTESRWRRWPARPPGGRVR